MYTDRATQIADLYVEYRYEQIQIENQKKLDLIEKRRRERQKKRHMIYYSIICICFIFVCVIFLHFELKIQNDLKQVSLLQAKITSIHASNTDTKKRIQQGVNYSQLQQQALNYGMHYPSSDEVVYYKPKDKDFMIQWNNIPN